MSISGSMSSALSGLNAAARSAELISSNIANALTPGYGRRGLEMSARRVGAGGQGVQINSVTREVNLVLMADRRVADAAASNMDTRAGFLQRIEASIGGPENAGSLSARIAALDASLLAAAAQPESTVRQGQVADAANSLVQGMRAISTEVQSARGRADQQIAADINTLNSTLGAIAELNRSIGASTNGGRDTSALLDQRQQLIDRISTIVPLREVARQNGSVALFTTGGAILLEGKAATIGFASTGLITPDMTLASGALSGLTINGRSVRSDDTGPMAGGSLAANFAIRDDIGTAAQSNLDALARDLISRFQDPALDSTLAPGDAGLFTDAGAVFAPANETGLAARLALNPAIDPDSGGALWRLRDGLGAAVPGPVGQSALLNAMQTALNAPRPTQSGPFAGATRGLSNLSAQLISSVSAQRLSLETDATYASVRSTALHHLELQNGVDTDRELQDLLVVEKAYAANAKVIQTADDMIQILLGM
ncbi:flagellar hook-associated protein FlgK [Pseudorhodobacter sp.]|uniref:flagellar hook-associated protein FlgK n=1 Tax=Pseudorhodobacter sp. TaxID=1934400 RepID=UPI0026480115|nr:flagellar hook-associated protein FlgK [Pseudorhodobacter sp.]MDN5786485.1 flagellar hook-associated protein FlgK [Pseudorhodobacter sp.]